MKIVRLQPGERAPEGSDTATIVTTSEGRYDVSGFSVDRITSPATFHTISEKSFPNIGEAESAGIRWANQHPIATLYIQRDPVK